MFQRMLKWLGLVKVPTVANFATTEAKLTTAERGTYAAQAFNNPVIIEALDELEKDAMITWKNTLVSEIETREFIWTHIKVLRQFRMKLAGYINEVKIEEHNRDSRTRQSGYHVVHDGNQAGPDGNQE